MRADFIEPSPQPSGVIGNPPVRLPWVDNLRTLLILLVVNIHACVTYSHVGGWYVEEKPEPAIGTKVVFLLWEGHLQAFFMGLLFFLAGFFAHFSIKRRGIVRFRDERLQRLGIPLLAFVFIIHPFVVFILNPWKMHQATLIEEYTKYLTSGRFAKSTGPLWFVETLLLFCLVFAAIRKLRPPRTPPGAPPARWTAIRTSRFLLLGLGLAGTSFLVRTVQPIETSILNLQLCYFPQYIAAFSLGVIVAQRFDLNSIARLPVAKWFGWSAVALGPLAQMGIVAAAVPAIERGEKAPFLGGWNPFALGYAVWEQLAAVALSLGIMAFALRRLNFETAWTHWLNERSFGVYVIHTPVLIALTMALRGFPAHENPFAMAGLLTVLGLIGSFLAADVLRRIPFVRAAF